MFLIANTTNYYQTRKSVNNLEMTELSQEVGFVRFRDVKTYYSNKVVTSTHAVFKFDSKEVKEITEDILLLFYSNSLTEYYGNN